MVLTIVFTLVFLRVIYPPPSRHNVKYYYPPEVEKDVVLGVQDCGAYRFNIESECMYDCYTGRCKVKVPCCYIDGDVNKPLLTLQHVAQGINYKHDVRGDEEFFGDYVECEMSECHEWLYMR